MDRLLNRKIPAPLPARRMLTRTSPSIPPVADLRAWDGPLKDQKSTGCCTGETKAESFEWIVRKYFPHLGPLVFSPMFAYVVELIAQGSFPQDDGSDGVTLCETAIAHGCCEESDFPFVNGAIVQPTPEQFANAAKHKIVGAYHGVQGSQVVLTILGDPVPWPVQVGFSVYESFMSGAIGKTGVMPVPEKGERLEGGHEVKLSGYDVGDTATLRPANCPPAVLVQNSWGKDWAIGGYFWMPLSVLDQPDTDIKIMHSGGPWH